MKVGNICGGVRPGPRVREETWWKRRGGGRRGRWGRETPASPASGARAVEGLGSAWVSAAAILTIVPAALRQGKHDETFPSSVSPSPSLLSDGRTAPLLLGDLTGERMQPFPLPMGRGRGPEGSRFPEVPTAHVLAPAIPQVPAWKSGVPGGFRPPGLRLAAAAAGEASGPAGQEPIIARTGERKSSSLPGL